MAYELDTLDNNLFKDTSNFIEIFYNFCKYCNIDTTTSNIQGVI